MGTAAWIFSIVMRKKEDSRQVLDWAAEMHIGPPKVGANLCPKQQ